MTSLPRKPLLPTGRVYFTPGAEEAAGGIAFLLGCLSRHQSGDWGEVCPDDAAMNDDALRHGGRILSVYPLDPARPQGEGTRIWVITEADRSATTCLLPEEY